MRSRIIRLVNTAAFAVVAGLILGALLASWVQGNAVRLMSCFFLAAWNTALLGLVALCAHVFNTRRLAHAALIGLLVGLVQLATLAITGYSDYWQNVKAVQQYGQTIIHQLEEYRAEHGHYPDVLDPAKAPRGPLRQSENTLVYYRADNGYLLTFLQADATGDFWIYDSSTRRWKLIHKAAGNTVWAQLR